MCITAITKAHHLSLSWARLIHSTPLPSYFSKTHFNIIHPSTLKSSTWCLSFMFPPPKPYMHFTSTTQRAHLIYLDQIFRIFGEDRKIANLPMCNFVYSLLMFLRLGPKISSSPPHPFPSTSSSIHCWPINVALDSTQTHGQTDSVVRKET